MARMLLNGESRFLSVCDVNGLGVAKRSPATTSTLEARQRLSSNRGQTGGTESRKVSTLSSLDVRDRVLIAIIADPTAPVYSFQARRPPTRMRRGATAATTSMPRQRLRSIPRESATQRTGIIHHHDVVTLEHRRQALPHIGHESWSIDRSVDDHRGHHCRKAATNVIVFHAP